MKPNSLVDFHTGSSSAPPPRSRTARGARRRRTFLASIGRRRKPGRERSTSRKSRSPAYRMARGARSISCSPWPALVRMAGTGSCCWPRRPGSRRTSTRRRRTSRRGRKRRLGGCGPRSAFSRPSMRRLEPTARSALRSLTSEQVDPAMKRVKFDGEGGLQKWMGITRQFVRARKSYTPKDDHPEWTRVADEAARRLIAAAVVSNPPW